MVLGRAPMVLTYMNKKDNLYILRSTEVTVQLSLQGGNSLLEIWRSLLLCLLDAQKPLTDHLNQRPDAAVQTSLYM